MKAFKHWILFPFSLLVGVFLAGCVAPDTIISRQQERPAAYGALRPETRILVDQGKIKVGMDTNAVYIAWGQPGEVTEGETAAGQSTAWTYYGSYIQEVRVWGWRRMYYDYYPINYISAQVTFTNGIVNQWQIYPSPGY
jgi:hypothetical protein